MLFELVISILIIFPISILAIYWILVRPQKRIYDALRCQGVPGEPFVPLVGQLPQFRRARDNDTLMVYQAELVQKYGHIFLIGYGSVTRLIINEPDILADILGRSHGNDYAKASDSIPVFSPVIGSNNLLLSQGAKHDRARKMLNPAFHFVNLQSMVSIMTDQTAKAIGELFRSSSSYQSIDLLIELNKLTLKIIACSAFGNDSVISGDTTDTMCRTFNNTLRAIEYRSMYLINQIPLLARLPFWRKNIVNEGSRRLSNFVDEIISSRRQGLTNSLCAGADILDLLLSAVDSEGQSFTDEEIKDEAMAFVMAGHETTGTLLTWALYVLMTEASVLSACRAEVEKVLLDGVVPTYEEINKLAVCEAILQETLRLYPPAPSFARVCTHEHTVGSDDHRQLRIPVGTCVVVSSYNLHRRAEFWPRPLEFDYTRWLRDPITNLKPKLPHPFCYLPFAAGSRNCIGQNFALLEAKVILAMLIQQCQFELEPGQKVTPGMRITMQPKYGLRAKVTKRQ